MVILVIDWLHCTEILLPMKINQFDELVERILSEAEGSFLSRLGSAAANVGRGVAQVYNAPANFAKGAAAVRSAVQGGVIPLKDKPKPDASGQGQTPASKELPKPGDPVRVQLRGLGAAPTGVAGRLENPKDYDGGKLYDVKLTGNPQVDKLRILDKPDPKGTMMRQVFYFDKTGMEVNPGYLKQKKLNTSGYFGMNPNVDKSKIPGGREWIFSDNEVPFLPQDQQAPGTPGKPPVR